MFELKKVVFFPLPFYVPSYKFTTVKSSSKFVKELEIFHFGENIFHRNESQGNVPSYKETLKVNFEYIEYVDKDEEKYRNLCIMTTLNKRLNRKTSISGFKCSSISDLE